MGQGLDRWLRAIAPLPAPLRLFLVLLTLALLWLPFLLGLTGAIADPNWRSITTLIVLYLLFLWLIQRWGRVAHGESASLVRFGLRGRQRLFQEQAVGLWLGVSLVFVMFALEAALGWANWTLPPANFGRIALEGLGVGLGIGFAEELLFRGWMWDELARDRPQSALFGTASIFAVLHFLKPWSEILRTWPQFPGLILLGLCLGYGKRLMGDRLGLPMGLHGGLVWGYYLINVGGLIALTKTAPAWVTGVDNNPLAGLVGLGFLAGLAIALRRLGGSRNSG